MSSQFEDDVADILTDFRQEKVNYAEAIIAIEKAIVCRLGLNLMADSRRDRRASDHPKRG